MPQPDIIGDVMRELKRAKRKHPRWPDHIVSCAAIVSKESGELVKAALQFKYENGSKPNQAHMMEMRKEAVQTAAMAIRFIQELQKIESNTTPTP